MDSASIGKLGRAAIDSKLVVTQTLKVFLVISRLDMKDSLARRDEG